MDKFIDPYVFGGQVLKPEDNPGTWLNHSLDSRNVMAATVDHGG